MSPKTVQRFWENDMQGNNSLSMSRESRLFASVCPRLSSLAHQDVEQCAEHLNGNDGCLLRLPTDKGESHDALLDAVGALRIRKNIGVERDLHRSSS